VYLRLIVNECLNHWFHRFGNVEVICEGYDYPDDPYILKGSCGLEYTLDYTMEGKKWLELFFELNAYYVGNNFKVLRINCQVDWKFMLQFSISVGCKLLPKFQNTDIEFFDIPHFRNTLCFVWNQKRRIEDCLYTKVSLSVQEGVSLWVHSPGPLFWYRAFHRFGQAKFPDGGKVLGSSLFSILYQLPPKTCSIQKWSKLTQK